LLCNFKIKINPEIKESASLILLDLRKIGSGLALCMSKKKLDYALHNVRPDPFALLQYDFNCNNTL